MVRFVHQMPHYHIVEATEAVKPVLGEYFVEPEKSGPIPFHLINRFFKGTEVSSGGRGCAVAGTRLLSLLFKSLLITFLFLFLRFYSSPSNVPLSCHLRFTGVLIC